MGKKRRKGESGVATTYISRNKALKKLQLSLPDFRRLCILKGIYPHEPKNLKKVNKGSTAYKTYYYAKDIGFLAHEPLLEKFRNFKVFMKRVKKAYHKDQKFTVQKLQENKPVYTLDHVVRERYPTFVDALRDIDDALCMVFLFSGLPKHRRLLPHVVQNCKRLSVEFMHYIIESRSLRKVFLSIKGIYYQAEVKGQTATWITPYQFTQKTPRDVDFRVMLTFVEFYSSFMGFINYKLYSTLNLKYPPQIEGLPPVSVPSQVIDESSLVTGEEEDNFDVLASLGQSLVRVFTEDDEEAMLDTDLILELDPEEQALQDKARLAEEKLTRFKNLFEGCCFFLARECPREALTFVIRSFGGVASWDEECAPGALYPEGDERITHHVVDRPKQNHRYLSRSYVQPQWAFDCINRQRLLPVEDYVPGAILPPHLSPFVVEGELDYMPPEREKELKEQVEEDTEEEDVLDEVEDKVDGTSSQVGATHRVEDSSRAMPSEIPLVVGAVYEGDIPTISPANKVEGETSGDQEDKHLVKKKREERQLAIMMMTKKRKHLFEQIMKSKKKKLKVVRELKRKRKEYEEGGQEVDHSKRVRVD